jgi:hypothetical protein
VNYNYYNLYGLTLQTTQEIKHLLPSLKINEIDVTINFEQHQTEIEYIFKHKSTEIHASYGLAQNNIPYLTIWKQFESVNEFLVIRYTDGKETAFFVSDKKGENVKVLYHPTIPIEDILTYFLGPVIGCVLRLKNKICLHASVVNIKGKAVAFIGEKAAGKSTLIATFASLGYPVLSDDIAVLFEKDKECYVELGYPRMRLWKNTIENLSNINIEDLKPVLSHIEKYYLPLYSGQKDQWNFQIKPLVLDKVFYLQPRNEDNLCQIKDCKSMKGFLKLKQNIYAEYMLEDDLKVKEFEVFGKLSNLNKVKLLDRYNDLNSLEEVLDIIVNYRD